MQRLPLGFDAYEPREFPRDSSNPRDNKNGPEGIKPSGPWVRSVVAFEFAKRDQPPTADRLVVGTRDVSQ